MRRGTGAFRPDAPVVSELAAGAVLVDPRSGQVLLLHHRGEDRWCFPKGHVEPGESLLGAAIREVHEETGIADVELRREVASTTYRFYDPARGLNVVKTSVYFLGSCSTQRPNLEALFDDHRWTDLASARALVPYDTDREVLDAVARALKTDAQARGRTLGHDASEEGDGRGWSEPLGPRV